MAAAVRGKNKFSHAVEPAASVQRSMPRPRERLRLRFRLRIKN